MPALARKTTPDHYDHRTCAPPVRPASKGAPRRRWHEEKPAARRENTPRDAPDVREVQELLSHFGHGSAAHEATVREHLNAKRVMRSRARRRHRPFQLSLTTLALSGAPLCLLASLLWLRSSALAMSRRDAKLQDQISVARFGLERTRKEIAALNASPHIEQWAKERGWQRATQKDFDEVPSAANGDSASTPNPSGL